MVTSGRKADNRTSRWGEDTPQHECPNNRQTGAPEVLLVRGQRQRVLPPCLSSVPSDSHQEGTVTEQIPRERLAAGEPVEQRLVLPGSV